MGAKGSFEKLPDENAAKDLANLIQSGNFESMIGALIAMQGEFEEQLEIEMSECYVIAWNKCEEEAINTLKMAEEADDKGDSAAAKSLREKHRRILLKLGSIGQKDTYAVLVERNPDFAERYSNMGTTWKTKFWKREDVKHIGRSRQGG